MLSLTGLASCMSLKPYPITTDTTKIVYAEHANSGVASQTRFELSIESLSWDFIEPRYNRHLRDVSTYEQQDFKTLITTLSKIKFSAVDSHDYSSGGSGWGCTFYDAKGSYLQFNDTYKLSGDYEQVVRQILDFAQSHKPDGLKRYESLKAHPHEQGLYGDFETLPTELERYAVSKP